MSEETKHSPLPWRYIPEDNIIIHEDIGRLVDIASPRSIDVSFEERIANGDFICRAVNAHEALVSACETTLTVLEAQNVIRVPELEIQLRAAIKLVNGGVA